MKKSFIFFVCVLSSVVGYAQKIDDAPIAVLSSHRDTLFIMDNEVGRILANVWIKYTDPKRFSPFPKIIFFEEGELKGKVRNLPEKLIAEIRQKYLLNSKQ